MTDNCNSCEYVNIRPEDLLKLGRKPGALTAIEVIPVLQNKQDYERIIIIASTLPNCKEIETIIRESLSEFSLEMEDVRKKLSDRLQKTVVAIEGALSYCLNDHPYRLSEQSIEDLHMVASKDAEGILFWEDKLLEVLSSKEELGEQIERWANYSKEIKSLIKVFHLPKDKMGELFREALEKSIELTGAKFWKDHFSEIADFIEVFNVPDKDARKIFEGVIEKGKKEYPATCVKIAQKMSISIDPQEFCKMADGLLKKANEETYSKSTRRELVSDACNTYILLEELYSFSGRESILRVYDSCAGEYSDTIGKTIFRASKVIKGEQKFKYKKQGIWDFHI